MRPSSFLLPAPVPSVNFIRATWRGGEAHARQTAISEFTFPDALARGDRRIRDSSCICADGCLDPISASADAHRGTVWTEQVLHSFKNDGTDGQEPVAGLIFDAAGNLYGTTIFGGTYDYGTVFELTPTAGGGWTEGVLHDFNFNGTDGFDPGSGLIFDAAGNLYGTTINGGTYGHGTVFTSPMRSRCCSTSMARTGLVPTPA